MYKEENKRLISENQILKQLLRKNIAEKEKINQRFQDILKENKALENYLLQKSLKEIQ